MATFFTVDLLVDFLAAATPVPYVTVLPIHVENNFRQATIANRSAEIEVAEVRDAENLALHRALAVGDDGAETVAELLHDHAGVHARRAL